MDSKPIYSEKLRADCSQGQCACLRSSERRGDVSPEVSVSVVRQKQILETHYKIKWSASKRCYRLLAYRDIRHDVLLSERSKNKKPGENKQGEGTLRGKRQACGSNVDNGFMIA